MGKRTDGVLPCGSSINPRVLKLGKTAGVASKSFTSTLLDVPSLSEEDERRIKWTAAAMYGGTFLLSFPLPATHHPTSQGGADTVRMSSSVVGAVYPHHLDSFGHSRILLGHDPFPRSTEKSTSRN